MTSVISTHLFVHTNATFRAPTATKLIDFLVKLLAGNARAQSSVSVTRTIRSIKTDLNASTTTSCDIVDLGAISTSFTRVFTLTIRLLHRPDFPRTRLSLRRQLDLRRVHSVRRRPFAITFGHLHRSVCNSRPCTLPDVNARTDIQKFARATLISFRHQRVHPSGIIITVIKHVDPSTTLSLIRGALNS